MPRAKITLKEAITKGKLREFIKQHAQDTPGDQDQFEKILKSATQTSSKAPPAFPEDSGEN